MASAQLHDIAFGAVVSVPLLRWPADRAEAERLEAEGLPFLLLLARQEPPPLSGYRFMDWVRSPVDPGELIARRSGLEARFARAVEGPRPHLDTETGRLTFGRRAVDLSPAQAALATPLVTEYRVVVPLARLRAAIGRDEDASAFGHRITRLRARLRAMGLDITCVRGVGYVLEPSR